MTGPVEQRNGAASLGRHHAKLPVQTFSIETSPICNSGPLLRSECLNLEIEICARSNARVRVEDHVVVFRTEVKIQVFGLERPIPAQREFNPATDGKPIGSLADAQMLAGLARGIERGRLDAATKRAALEYIAARQSREGLKVTGRRPPRPERRSPDRQASIDRRRRIVASGPLPPQLAARFTWGELAALAIIGNEVRRHGTCWLHIDTIAAMAGVHRTTVQNALRKASDDSEGRAIIERRERRRAGQRSLTNIIHIVSPEWLTWLRRARPAAFGLALDLGSKNKKGQRKPQKLNPSRCVTGRFAPRAGCRRRPDDRGARLWSRRYPPPWPAAVGRGAAGQRRRGAWVMAREPVQAGQMGRDRDRDGRDSRTPEGGI
jgi:hypothetical protein